MSSRAQGNNNNDNTREEQEQEEKKKNPPREEFNARSVGYLLIALGSLINVSSVSNVEKDKSDDFEGRQSVGIAFGATTFGLSLLILILDRTITAVDYTKAAGGKLEGCTLLFFTLVWTAGLGYLTQVGGIAYVALNVYASSWITWALCIHTLNQWSASKDILSIDELTGISETLKSWYVLAISSMVVTVSCINFWLKLRDGDMHINDAIFAFCFSAASTLLSLSWILTHMNFLECCKEGGWMELASAWVCILVWIVNCAVLTRDEGMGATIIGTLHQQPWRLDDSFLVAGTAPDSTIECRLVWQVMADGNSNTDQSGTEGSIEIDCPLDHGIPGSNLYVACWISLAASVNIALRWNAQRALELAQPTRPAMSATISSTRKDRSRSSTQPAKSSPQQKASQAALSIDDDDDLEDFIDANAY